MHNKSRSSLWSQLCLASLAVMAIAIGSSGAFAATNTSNSMASLPAVSGLNGAVDLRGGAANDNMTGLLSGKVSAPVTHDFGVQFDGTIGNIGGNSVDGVGAHAFYRNPSQMLVGGTLQRGWYTGQHYNRFGAEGEYYQGNLTYAARIGYQNGTVRHGEYTNLDLNWYLNDNLVVTPGFRNISGHDWGRVATEWQPQAFKIAPGLTLFGSTGAGNHGYAFGILGVRYYFGNDKTLVRRHREDDPSGVVSDDLMDNASQFRSTVSPPPPT